MNANMTNKLKITLFFLFLFQILVASGFELAFDEAYYWLYSKNLDFGFFDHPPFVGVVIKLFSFLPHSELSVRLGFIVLQFCSLLLLMGLTTYSLIPLLLFFSFPLASFTGLLALPDIPLLFMTSCYCVALKRFLKQDSTANSLVLGTVIALLFYAKYHGVLLVFFTIVAIPRLLLRKSFYVTALISLVLFFPHMWWQHQHDYATLRYHFMERPSSTFSFKRSLEFILLQIGLTGLFVGPVLWWIVFRQKAQSDFTRAMKVIAIGTVLFFLFSSFNKKIEANWTIFLTIPLIYLVSSNPVLTKKWAKNLLYASFTIVMLARILFLSPTNVVEVKRLKEFHGWKQWSRDIQYVCAKESIVANTYQIASKLSYYLNLEVPALNYHSRKNQFDYWQFEEHLPTKKVCYVTDKSGFSGIPIKSPDGKTFQILKNQSVERLWGLK